MFLKGLWSMMNRKAYAKYLPLIYLPIALISTICMLLYYPQIAHYSFFVVPSFLVLSCFIFLASKPHSLVTSQKTINNTALWLASWMGLQLAIAVFFYAAMRVTADLLVLPQQTIDSVPGVLIQHFIYSGFYPWSLYLLLSIAFTFFTARDDKHLPFRFSLLPLFKKSTDGYFGAGIDLCLKQGLLLVCAFSSALFLVSINHFLRSALNLPMLISEKLEILLFTTAFFLILMSPQWKIALKYFLEKKLPLWMLFIGLGIAFIIISTVFSAGEKIISYVSSMPSTPIVIDLFKFSDPKAIWDFTYIILGTLCAPQIAKYVSQLSSGYSIRAILAAGLILPVIILLLFGADKMFWHQQLLNGLNSLLQNSYVILLFSIAGFLLVSYFFYDPRKLFLTNLANCSKKKTPVTYYTLYNLPPLIIMCFLLNLAGGIAIIMVIIGGVTLPALFFSLLISLGTFYRCCFQR